MPGEISHAKACGTDKKYGVLELTLFVLAGKHALLHVRLRRAFRGTAVFQDEALVGKVQVALVLMTRPLLRAHGETSSLMRAGTEKRRRTR